MALATPLRLLLPTAASPARPPDPAGPSFRALPSRQGHLRSSLATAPPSPAARTVAAAAGAGGGRPTVLVTEKLGSAGLDLLREFANVDCSYELTTEELRAKVSLVDALVVRSATRVTREVFEAARGRLRVVGRAGVGIDNVDLQAATEAGCLVVNAPTANTVAAAEHAVALITAMARNVAQADASLKAGTYACPSPRAR
jgi:D-3-phosphoglycerate dehydrogenase / 2-oxoglutarate reductase